MKQGSLWISIVCSLVSAAVTMVYNDAHTQADLVSLKRDVDRIYSESVELRNNVLQTRIQIEKAMQTQELAFSIRAKENNGKALSQTTEIQSSLEALNQKIEETRK